MIDFSCILLSHIFVVMELACLASEKAELLNLCESAMDLQPSDFVLAAEQQGLKQVVAVYINSFLIICLLC